MRSVPSTVLNDIDVMSHQIKGFFTSVKFGLRFSRTGRRGHIYYAHGPEHIRLHSIQLPLNRNICRRRNISRLSLYIAFIEFLK